MRAFFHQVVAFALLLFATSGCSRERTLIAPTDLRVAPDGASVKQLPFGQVLSVRRSLGDPPGWLRARDGDISGFVRDSMLVTTPLIGVERYVVVPSTVAVDGPAGERGLKRYRAAAKVEIVLDTLPSTAAALRVLAVEQGRPVGFVDVRDIASEPPTPSNLVARALDRLAVIDLPGMQEHAQAALDIGPAAPNRNPQALELIGQLLTDRDWQLSQKLLQERGALALWPDVKPVGTPAVGESGYVTATRLKLRVKRDVASKARAEIPIGSVVLVLEHSGEWLRVKSDGGAVARSIGSFAALSNADATPLSITGEGALEGWVRARFVDVAEPTEPTLNAALKQATEQGDLALITLWHQRLFALSPSVQTQRAFIAAAIKSGHLAAAVDAAKQQAPQKPTPSVVTLDAFFGCRGDPLRLDVETLNRATFDKANQRIEHAHACLVATSVHEVCEPRTDAADDGEDDDGDGLSEAARIGVQHEAAVAEHEKDLRALSEAFPSPPKLRISLSNPAALPAGAQLFLARVGYENVGDCYEQYQLDETFKLIRIPLPDKPPPEALHLWLDIEDRGDVLFGAFLTTTQTSAEQMNQLIERAIWDVDGEPLQIGRTKTDGQRPDTVLALPSDPCALRDCGC